MIRTANQADIEDIIRVVAAAFHLEPGAADYQSRRDMILRTDADQWQVCLVDGRMVGALHIKTVKLRIGRAVLLNGDVGEVSIVPDLQGGGIGTELMTYAVLHMRENGYDLSRLGGLCRFYSRFGYVRFPRRTVEITVGKRMRAGYPEVFHGAIPISLRPRATVREADPSCDNDSWQRLWDEFTSFYSASPYRDSPVSLPLPRPNKLVYVEDGEVLALMDFGEQTLRDGQRYIDCTTVFSPQNPAGLKHLVAHVYNHALDQEVPRISAHLPFDVRVTSVLSEMPIFFDLVESYGGIVSSMLQIVSLKTLFEHLKPELEHRLAESEVLRYDGGLSLETDRDSVSLAVRGGAIEVRASETTDTRVHLGECHLLQMVLGLLSFDELADSVAVNPPARTLLRALFPRRPVYSGVWG